MIPGHSSEGLNFCPILGRRKGQVNNVLTKKSVFKQLKINIEFNIYK